MRLAGTHVRAVNSRQYLRNLPVHRGRRPRGSDSAGKPPEIVHESSRMRQQAKPFTVEVKKSRKSASEHQPLFGFLGDTAARRAATAGGRGQRQAVRPAAGSGAIRRGHDAYSATARPCGARATRQSHPPRPDRATGRANGGGGAEAAEAARVEAESRARKPKPVPVSLSAEPARWAVRRSPWRRSASDAGRRTRAASRAPSAGSAACRVTRDSASLTC